MILLRICVSAQRIRCYSPDPRSHQIRSSAFSQSTAPNAAAHFSSAAFSRSPPLLFRRFHPHASDGAITSRALSSTSMFRLFDPCVITNFLRAYHARGVSFCFISSVVSLCIKSGRSRAIHSLTAFFSRSPARLVSGRKSAS